MSSVLLLTLALFAPQSLDAAPKPKGEPKAEEPLTHIVWGNNIVWGNFGGDNTVTPAEPVEATGPAPTTTITLPEGGLL